MKCKSSVVFFDKSTITVDIDYGIQSRMEMMLEIREMKADG